MKSFGVGIITIFVTGCLSQPSQGEIASDITIRPMTASVVGTFVDPTGLHLDASITMPSGTMPVNGWPIVIPFHIKSGTHIEALSRMGFGSSATWPASDIADRAIILWPDGTKYGAYQVWNATTGCCDPPRNVDDVGYVEAAYAYLVSHYTVDATKAIVMGMSNGGFMAEAAMCAHPEHWTRAVDVSGGAPKPCALSDGLHTISILKDHGDNDGTIYWDSMTPVANSMTSSGMTDTYPAADDASQYGCASFVDTGVTKDFESVTGNETHVLAATGCPAGTTIELDRAYGGTHSPGWVTSKWRPYVLAYLGI